MLRKKTPRGSVIAILNTHIDKLGISITLLGSLKSLELNKLSEVKNLIEDSPEEIKNTIGKTSLNELKRIFKKNSITLPKDF